MFGSVEHLKLLNTDALNLHMQLTAAVKHFRSSVAEFFNDVKANKVNESVLVLNVRTSKVYCSFRNWVFYSSRRNV